MKILHVSHLFLPRHRGGVEIYTAALARAQARRGHDVRIFTSDHLPAERDYGRSEMEWAGIPVTVIVNCKNYRDPKLTVDDPSMERQFEAILDEFRPDVVHLQHLLYHSAGYVPLLKRRGIPAVFTLHEYWLLCLRGGQMLLPDRRRCDDPPDSDCARCLASGAGLLTRGEIASNRALRRVKAVTGVNLWPLSRAVRVRAPFGLRRLLKRETLASRSTAGGPPDWALQAVRQRQSRFREIAKLVDLFVAPSPFLRDRFLAWGVPESRMVYSDYGFEIARFSVAPRPSETLRFGFVGAVIPSKGVHVLVEAWNRMRDGGRATCEIWGGTSHRPDYAAECRRASRRPGLRFRGEFEPVRAPEVFASLDVLVVPSIWFENSPLTIHEGFLAGLPVITSDLGGMRDLVEHERSGLRFPPDDPEALSAAMQRFVDEPGLLARLRAGVPRVKPIDEHAVELDRLYARLLASQVRRAEANR